MIETAFVLGLMVGATVAVLCCIACPEPRPTWRTDRRGREHVAAHRIGEHFAAELPVVPRWWTDHDHSTCEFVLALTARFTPARKATP